MNFHLYSIIILHDWFHIRTNKINLPILDEGWIRTRLPYLEEKLFLKSLGISKGQFLQPLDKDKVQCE